MAELVAYTLMGVALLVLDPLELEVEMMDLLEVILVDPL